MVYGFVQSSILRSGIPFCIFVKCDRRFYSFDNDKASWPYMTHSSAPSFLQRINNFITYQVLIISVSVETFVIFCLSLICCECTLTDDKVVPARPLAWIGGRAVSGTCSRPFRWPGTRVLPFQAHARRFSIGLDRGLGRFRHMLSALPLAWIEGWAVSGTCTPFFSLAWIGGKTVSGTCTTLFHWPG